LTHPHFAGFGRVGEAHSFGEVGGLRRVTTAAVGVGIKRFKVLSGTVAGLAVGKTDCFDCARHAEPSVSGGGRAA